MLDRWRKKKGNVGVSPTSEPSFALSSSKLLAQRLCSQARAAPEMQTLTLQAADRHALKEAAKKIKPAAGSGKKKSPG